MKQTAPIDPLWQRLLYDPRIRSQVIQFSVLSVIIWLAYSLITNTAHNLEQAGIASGFDFLEEPAGFDISMSFIDYDRTSTYFGAYLVGLVNTLVMTLICIVTSTIVGFATAVFRLSPNWLMSRIAGIYIEVARNIPLLLLILFVYLAMLSPLPGPKQALNFSDIIFLCNRGLIIPQAIGLAGANYVWFSVFFSLILSVFICRYGKKHQEKTGKYIPIYLYSFICIVTIPLATYFAAGSPIDWDIPKLSGFNFKGGLTILPEFLALCVAMTVYMGAFIGENIRSGIESVPSGQTEAASALGLRQGHVMRLVIIPQALRVIIPPVSSQYLTLAKNISLGVVIGYPDIVSVFAGTTLNQTGQAVEVVSLTMLTYLIISLVISTFMDWYNNKVMIKER